MNQPSDPNQPFVKIGQAAKTLNVSIDTLRRWDKAGKISAIRTPGNTRLYSSPYLSQISQIGLFPSHSLTISQAAQKLGVSVKTLRRWDRSGKLPAQRSETGQRIYQLEDMVRGDSDRNSQRVTATFSQDGWLIKTAAALTILTIFTTAVITAGYLKAPQQTKNFLAADKTLKQSSTQEGQVLGIVSDTKGLLQRAASVVLLPFDTLSKRIISSVSPQKAQQLGFTTTENQLKQLTQKNDNLVKDLGKMTDKFSSINNQLTQFDDNLNNLPTGINLVPNSSFEANDNGLPNRYIYVGKSSAANTFLTQEIARSGLNSLKFVGGTELAEGLGILNTDTVSGPARPYHLSFYLKSYQTGPFNLDISFWDTDKKVRTQTVSKKITESDLTDSSSGWQLLQFDLKSPGPSQGKNWFPVIEITNLTKGVVYLDDVAVKEIANSGYAQVRPTGAISTLGDGAVFITAGGEIYPYNSKFGSLGVDGKRFQSVYLTNASIDKDGVLNVSGTATFNSTLNVSGNSTLSGNLAVNGGDITTTATTATLFNATATTLSLGGAATTALNLGNGSGNYTAINLGSGSGTHTINIAGTGATAADTINIGSGGTGADTITIGNSASSTSLALTSGTGSQTFSSSATTGTAFSFVANSVTTGNAITVSSTGTTTGEILDITGTWAPTDGSTNEAIDLNITHTPTTSADNFRSIDLDTSDGTALGNTVYNYDGTLTLTGNAAKTGYGIYQTVTTSSTTADTIYAVDLATSATGVIGSGTRSNYGLRTQPASTGANTAGTQNMYGMYSAPSSTLAAGSTENVYGGYFGGTATVASGTINRYGLYVANATMNTTGTSTQYGLYIEDLSGASTNYALIVAGADNVGIGDTTPAALLTVGSGDLFQVNSNGSITQAQSAVSGGQVAVSLTPGAHTAVTAEVIDLSVLTHTNTITGAYTTQRFTNFAQPVISAASALTITTAATQAIAGTPNPTGAGPATITNAFGLMLGTALATVPAYSASAATTISNAAMLYIAGAPATGGNVTVSTGYALWVDAGTTRLDGNLNITGASGITFDGANDIDIDDNTASALTISEGTSNYFLITTTDTVTVVTLDLPVAGSSTTTGNLFTANTTKTINLGTGTSADTINIGTGGTTADAISFGNSGVGTTTTFTQGSGNLTANLAGTGDLVVQDNGTTFFTLSDTSTIAFDPATTFSSGGLIDIELGTQFVGGTMILADYGTATTLSGNVTGMTLDFNTNVTPIAGGNVNGYNILTPTFTQTTTDSTAFRAFFLSTAGALTQNTNAGTLSWEGLNMAMPNITQTTGTVSAEGLRLINGTITTGGEQNIIKFVASGVGAGSLDGLDISAITAGNGTETAIKIGAGWDDAINVNSGQAIVEVTGVISVGLDNTATTAGLCHSGTDVDVATDTTRDIVACSAAPDDYAEWYETEPDVEFGDLVALTDKTFTYQATQSDPFTGMIKEEKVTKTLPILAKASQVNNTRLFGFISTSPIQVIGSDVKNQGSHPMPIALNGRVPAKVSTENGPIEVGDFLTSSSTPGVAMKATSPGPVVGKALESFSCQSTSQVPGLTSGGCQGKILAFVNISFADPNNFLANLSLDQQGNLIIPKIKTNQLLLGQIGPISLISQGTTVVSADPATSPTTTNLQPTTYFDLSGQIASLEERIKRLEAQNLSTQQATPSAQLADGTSSLNLTPPDTLLATSSATLANLKVFSEATFSAHLLAYDLSVSNIFKSLGQTFLGKTIVAGDLTVDGTLSISQNSINSYWTDQTNGTNLGGILYLQNSPLTQGLDLFNGKVTIDKEGKLTAQTVIASEYRGVKDQSVGSGKILANTKSVDISSALVKTTSKILLTPTIETSLTLSVTSKLEGQKFTVTVSQNTPSDLDFDWFIINEQSPTASEGSIRPI